MILWHSSRASAQTTCKLASSVCKPVMAACHVGSQQNFVTDYVQAVHELVVMMRVNAWQCAAVRAMPLTCKFRLPPLQREAVLHDFLHHVSPVCARKWHNLTRQILDQKSCKCQAGLRPEMS